MTCDRPARRPAQAAALIAQPWLPLALLWQIAKFVEQRVLPLLGRPAGGRCLLDVGAGDASLAPHLLPHFPGRALAVDINAATLVGEDSCTIVMPSSSVMAHRCIKLLPSTVTSQTILGVLEELALPYSVTPLNDRRNFVASEAHLHLVLRFLAEEASEGAAQQAAVISKCVAEWPRWQDGGFPLHQDSDCILIG
ncbi:hypothetical protein ABPG75_008174 [Micractinium tetrahymenae]